MSAAPDPSAAPQTLADFQQRIATELLASQKAFADQLIAQQQQFVDATLAAIKDQQAKFAVQTAELAQALHVPMPAELSASSGDSGQPQAAKPAASAGPT